MKKYISLPILAILLALAPAPGEAYNNGAPTLKCFNCHVAVGEHASVLNVTGIPESYQGGKTYPITVTVDSDVRSLGQVQGGFAVQVSAGELLVVDKANTQISDRILTHTQQGSALRTWKLAWKAPREKQQVDITVMATAANGDFAPLGDPVVAHAFTSSPRK